MAERDGAALEGGDRSADVPRGVRFFLFASPQLALATFGLPILIYLPAYYAGPLGVGLAATGVLFMVARVWDVFTDGVLGWAVDRFPTRWGRRRIWMLLSAPLMAVSALALCFPPPGAGALWLLLGLVLLYLWWTLIHLSHLAWAAELSDRYDERSTIQGRVMEVYFLGLLVVLTAPILLAALFGDTSLAAKVQAMGLYSAILIPLTVVAAVVVARERPVPPAPADPLGFAEGLGIAARNGALLRLLAVDMLAGLSGGTASGLFVYVTGELFRLEGRVTVAGMPLDPGILLLVTFAGALLGVPLWLRLSYRIGKHRAVACAAMLAIAAFLYALLMPRGSFLWAGLFYLANGIAFAAPPFLDRAILADVVDLDRSQSGEQRTGFFFALLSMTNKLGYAIPVGILFPVLAAVGFDPNGGNDAAAIGWLAALFVGVPLACNLAIIALLWRFPITRERQEALRRALANEALP